MRAIILAAGRGSRMKSLTNDMPKGLVELNGKPLISHQIAALRAADVDEIGLVTGYRREMLQGFADKEFHNNRWSQTNMVSSMLMASEWLKSGPCIVSYSDIFYEAAAVNSLIEKEAPLALTYDPNWLSLWEDRFGDPLLDAETFRLDIAGRLLDIGRKPSTVDEVEGQYMGLLRFTPDALKELCSVLETIPKFERDQIQMTNAIQCIIERGNMPVHAVSYDGVWGEVDTAEDLELYQAGDEALR